MPPRLMRSAGTEEGYRLMRQGVVVWIFVWTRGLDKKRSSDEGADAWKKQKEQKCNRGGDVDSVVWCVGIISWMAQPPAGMQPSTPVPGSDRASPNPRSPGAAAKVTNPTGSLEGGIGRPTPPGRGSGLGLFFVLASPSPTIPSLGAATTHAAPSSAFGTQKHADQEAGRGA
ncbi:hypothetical protein GGTG_06461 [Gaeumannomyces tritici R3-111a-1]|uniref:Uncharacterized protein n=1 Tax=Gaeumannomyces tritici (strain R3-111a-1) TaxID=644352 RepID=J3NYV9_GAET3|nr:hypothetical protein GGTG_06461 [Gaeumannomyces tritici R3-111a-1]EJT76542.1 hypothetical protein GGTG_06461 [Gaeumannomyces tritici R3-111a-1]